MIKKKNRYKIKKKKKFYFGLKDKIAKIYLRRTYTNMFLTLTDLNDKVIICKTPASSDREIKNKRKKRIAFSLEKMLYDIRVFLKLYEVINIQLVLKMKVKSHIYYLLEKLNSHGLIVKSIVSLKIIPHNGVRGRRLRRT